MLMLLAQVTLRGVNSRGVMAAGGEVVQAFMAQMVILGAGSLLPLRAHVSEIPGRAPMGGSA